MSKSTKEEKSVIDEVVELKFGKGAKSDPKKTKMILEFLDDLYCELNSIDSDEDSNDNDDDENNNSKKNVSFDREMVSSINSEDKNDEMIPFIVVKKENTVVDIQCPFCGSEDKIFINMFRSSQYNDHECTKCKKTSLLKLNFEPNVKTYIEKMKQ